MKHIKIYEKIKKIYTIADFISDNDKHEDTRIGGYILADFISADKYITKHNDPNLIEYKNYVNHNIGKITQIDGVNITVRYSNAPENIRKMLFNYDLTILNIRDISYFSKNKEDLKDIDELIAAKKYNL